VNGGEDSDSQVGRSWQRLDMHRRWLGRCAKNITREGLADSSKTASMEGSAVSQKLRWAEKPK